MFSRKKLSSKMDMSTFLLLLFQSLGALAFQAPHFTLNADRSLDGIPSVTVTFPDGYTDNLILDRHYSNQDDELMRSEEADNCNFIGHLEKEQEACVAMTGCPGYEDLDFTIFSSHAKDSPLFTWTKDGHVEVVPQKNTREVSIY